MAGLISLLTLFVLLRLISPLAFTAAPKAMPSTAAELERHWPTDL